MIKISSNILGVIQGLDKDLRAKNRKVKRALKVNAMELADRMKKNVALNQTRGRAYKRGGVIRHASRRGAFPNTQTGFLGRSIQVSSKTTPDSVFVVVGARYASALESGRRNMAARPFVKPTIEQTYKRMRLRVLRALSA